MNNTFILFFQALEQSMIFNISVLVYFKLSIIMCRSMFERFSYAMSDIKHTVNTETMFCFETSLTRG